jgi:hypothetical protein
MHERFIDEPLEPVVATADTSLMAAGGPGLPKAFWWHGQLVQVTAVLRAWRETGPCRHGSGEMYARKHWFEIATGEQKTMKIYFARQSRRSRKEPRWWLFSVSEPD